MVSDQENLEDRNRHHDWNSNSAIPKVDQGHDKDRGKGANNFANQEIRKRVVVATNQEMANRVLLKDENGLSKVENEIGVVSRKQADQHETANQVR